MAGVVTPRWACGPARGRITERMEKISYIGYRFPPEIIHQAIWLYLQLKYRNGLLMAQAYHGQRRRQRFGLTKPQRQRATRRCDNCRSHRGIGCRSGNAFAAIDSSRTGTAPPCRQRPQARDGDRVAHDAGKAVPDVQLQ
jgi:hypothetical protein